MTGYLLDTNVISELVKRRPERRVVEWVDSVDEALLHLSVLTLGEIRKGVQLLSDARRRAELAGWLESGLAVRFAGRILPLDAETADRWGVLAAQAAQTGRALPVIDGLLAASALQHNLVFVTRNTKDTASGPGPLTFNPWEQ